MALTQWCAQCSAATYTATSAIANMRTALTQLLAWSNARQLQVSSSQDLPDAHACCQRLPFLADELPALLSVLVIHVITADADKASAGVRGA